MAQSGAKEQNDQSMEEILQSIKRIIAEEGDEPASAAPAANGKHPGLPGSEVLELTDIVDVSPAAAAPQPIAPPRAAEPKAAPMPAPPPPPAPSVAAPAPAPVAKPAALMPPAPPSPAEKSNDVLDDIDSLLSREVARSSTAALRTLSERAHGKGSAVGMPHFRSGATVEDLVLEALRPMLKDWLDQNLSPLVERLVEKEIRKLTSDI